MKKKLALTICLAFSLGAYANSNKSSAIEDQIQRLNWNGIDVIYIEDNRFPTYDLTVYFADGALSDKQGQKGLTEHSFNLLDAGTDKLSQKEILEQMEFLGTDFSVNVTHEYSTISVSGLTKDMEEAMTQMCSLLRSATYPENVIRKEIELERVNLQGLVSSHSGLAERVFREISLSETPYAYPVSGKLADFKSYTPQALRAQMNYFLDNVKKRIYLTGPVSTLQLKNVLAEKCRFVGAGAQFVRSVDSLKIRPQKTEFVFVPVPDANQVQLRIGRFLNHNETNERNLDALASDFLGGGFTSRLMREVRVKRGLTYSIGSFISSQKQYGRAGISTFTKNETINRLIEVIDETISKISKEGITDQDLNHAMEGMVGAYPFKFESNPAFLGQLMLLDHIDRPYADLFSFRESVQQYSGADVAKKISDVFGMNKQVIFVLGDKSIEPSLRRLAKKFGSLRVVDYKKYL